MDTENYGEKIIKKTQLNSPPSIKRSLNQSSYLIASIENYDSQNPSSLDFRTVWSWNMIPRFRLFDLFDFLDGRNGVLLIHNDLELRSWCFCCHRSGLVPLSVPEFRRDDTDLYFHTIFSRQRELKKKKKKATTHKEVQAFITNKRFFL